jgi:hypothetical protein
MSMMLLVVMAASPSLSSPFLSTGNSNTDSLLGGAALGVAGGLLLGKAQFCLQKARTYLNKYMLLLVGTLFNGQRGGRSYGNSYYSPGGYRSSGKGERTARVRAFPR